jgi:hypothetical protein
LRARIGAATLVTSRFPNFAYLAHHDARLGSLGTQANALARPGLAAEAQQNDLSGTAPRATRRLRLVLVTHVSRIPGVKHGE